MRNIWTIAKREFKQYFISPVAYVVMFLFLLLMGLFFYLEISQAIQMSIYQPYTPSAQMVFGWMVMLILFTVPAVTMRSLAEEQRMGTMELLLTAPVRDWELVVGKWLGGVLFMITLLAITWVYPILINMMTSPGIDQGPLITGYLGMLLMVSGIIAIGVAISSLSGNQVVAFFITLALVLLVWIIQPGSDTTGGLLNTVLKYLNFRDHYLTFYQGAIEIKDIVYYLSVTALGLFLGSVSVETRRWR